MLMILLLGVGYFIYWIMTYDTHTPNEYVSDHHSSSIGDSSIDTGIGIEHDTVSRGFNPENEAVGVPAG